jgi:diguanylate cyclase (GGDEF)-like protein
MIGGGILGLLPAMMVLPGAVAAILCAGGVRLNDSDAEDAAARPVRAATGDAMTASLLLALGTMLAHPVLWRQIAGQGLAAPELPGLLVLGLFVGLIVYACLDQLATATNLLRPLAGLILAGAIGIGAQQFGEVTGTVASVGLPGALLLLICAAMAAGAFWIAGGAAGARSRSVAGLMLALALFLPMARLTSQAWRGVSGGSLAGDGFAVAADLALSVAALLAAAGMFVSALLLRRRSAREALAVRRDVQAWIGDIAEATPEPLGILESQTLVYANAALLDLLGQPRHLVEDRPLADLFPRAGRGWRMAAMCARLPEWSGVKLACVGGLIDVEVAVRALKGGAWRLLQCRDIRPRLESDARIQYLTRHDPLTGLLNRATLLDALNRRIGEARIAGASFALALLDLDGFEAFNERHGHAAGDAMLQEVGRRLTEVMGPEAPLSRIAADEFAVMLPINLEIREAERRADRMLQAIAEPFAHSAATLSVTACAGVAIFPRDTDDADHLLIAAGIALQRAKDHGRQSVAQANAERDSEARANRLLEQDLRFAIARRELRVWLQPQVDARTGDIVGFEALLRWQHPVHGLLSPDRFVPLAESGGLIHEIGLWVLREAARIAAGLPRTLSIAVNVSPVQLRQSGIARKIAEVLAETGLPPERLDVEITESIVLDSGAEALRALNDIRAMGVRVSLDDFGTGYSSLSTLRAFPFDKMKIDRSFMRDLVEEPKALEMVRAILAVGRALGLIVVAEGVETLAQAQILADAGCAVFQGFLFSRPQPADAFASMPPGGQYADLLVGGTLSAMAAQAPVPLQNDEGREHGGRKGDAGLQRRFRRRSEKPQLAASRSTHDSRDGEGHGKGPAEKIECGRGQQHAQLDIAAAEQPPAPRQHEGQQAHQAVWNQQPDRVRRGEKPGADQDKAQAGNEQGVGNPASAQIDHADQHRPQGPDRQPDHHAIDPFQPPPPDPPRRGAVKMVPLIRVTKDL